MKNISILILITVGALAQVSDAIAGHEWTDGTMGPPGQSYDTAMPIFPSARKISPKPSEAPSRACDSKAFANRDTGASAIGTREQQHQSISHPTTAADEREICRNRTP